MKQSDNKKIDKPTLQSRIDALKEQQERAKELFLKCQGAVELLEGMAEEEKPKAEKKV